MNFPVKRPVWRPRIRKILFFTKYFLMDEFSSKTVCVTPQNCPIDDWMNFPVKRSRWQFRPKNKSFEISRNSAYVTNNSFSIAYVLRTTRAKTTRTTRAKTTRKTKPRTTRPPRTTKPRTRTTKPPRTKKPRRIPNRFKRVCVYNGRTIKDLDFKLYFEFMLNLWLFRCFLELLLFTPTQIKLHD